MRRRKVSGSGCSPAVDLYKTSRCMAIFSSGLLLVSWYCFVRVQHKFDQPLIPVGLLLLLSSHLAGVRLFFRRDSCWSLAVSLFESSRRSIHFSSGLLLVFCFTPRISGVFDRILIGTSVDLLSSTSRVSLMLDQFLIATPFGLLFIHSLPANLAGV